MAPHVKRNSNKDNNNMSDNTLRAFTLEALYEAGYGTPDYIFDDEDFHVDTDHLSFQIVEAF
ncbi:MAG: hypothetical protein GY861_04775 [bacterium]|nr:hypothetical protein [bacterium]